MDIGHLYDDSFFGSLTTALDVKERLQTQEINAREERSFEKWVKIFQRGKDMCKRNMDCEKWQAQRALYTIWERTPRLEKSLAAEKARVASLEKSILTRANSEKKNKISAGIFCSHRLKTSSQTGASFRACPPGDDPETRDESKHQVRLKERPLNTDFRLQRSLHKQADFVRRSQCLVRSLARLNWRQQKRKRNQEKFREELFRLSKPVIAKARVVLKGRSELDSNQYLDELENYLLHVESGPTPGKQTYTLSEDKTQEVLHNDSLVTRCGLVNSYNGDHYAVLPPVLTASLGDAAQDVSESTKDHNFNSDRNNTDHNNKLKVGGNTEDSTKRHPESRAEPGKQIQRLVAATSVNRLQEVRNTTSRSRYVGKRLLLPPLKTSQVVTEKRVASKQGINNNNVFINNSQEDSNISNENRNVHLKDKKTKSPNVIGKIRNIDKDKHMWWSGVNNVTSLIRPHVDAVNDRNKHSGSNNFASQTCNEIRNMANLHGAYNKDDFDTSNNKTSCTVNERSNTCNYNVSSFSDWRSNTSNYDTIATSTKRNDNCNDNSIFASDKGSNTFNSRISSVKNRRSDVSNPNTGEKKGDASKDSLARITVKGNDSCKSYSRINKRNNSSDVVISYQGHITSDNISSNSKQSTHSQSSIPWIEITKTDNYPEIVDPAVNTEKEINDNPTTTARYRRFMDVDNCSNPVRIHQNLNSINRGMNNTTNIHNGVFQVIPTNSESNNEDSRAVSHASENSTDNNKNTKNSTECRQTYNGLSNNTTRGLLNRNISSGNDLFTSTGKTIEGRNTNGVVNTNTNNTYNNTTVSCEYGSCNSAETSRDANSSCVQRGSSNRDVSTHNEGRENGIDIALTMDTAQHGGSGLFIEKSRNDDKKKATFQEDDDNEPVSECNTWVTCKGEIIGSFSREIFQNTDRETNQNSGSEVIKNSSSGVIKNSSSGVIKNNSSEVIKNSSSEVIKNANREIIKNANREIIKNANREIIKNANKETFRISSVLAARKSSNIFAPPGGVSQVIFEEDE